MTHLWRSWYSTVEKQVKWRGQILPSACVCVSGVISWKRRRLLLVNRRCASGLWIWREFLISNFLYVSSCNHNYQTLIPLIPVFWLTSAQDSEIPNIFMWTCASPLVVGIFFLFAGFLYIYIYVFFWSGAQQKPGSHNWEEAVSSCSFSWAVITICQECSLFCNSTFPHSTIV